jgi:hypothetical protein
MTHVPGPWISESGISDDTEERGLAVIAVLPKFQRTPEATPTRGMVAWIPSGIGACMTDEEAIDTARLIAAAPDLLATLRSARDRLALVFEASGRDPRDDATVREIDTAIEKATGE